MPYITYHPLPLLKYTWEDFQPRIKMWMKADNDNLTIEKEYYDVTTGELFEKIVGNKIEKIEFLKIEGNTEPFGVKILFKDDYIISIPNADGNNVETKMFNKNDGIENFRRLGNVIYSSE